MHDQPNRNKLALVVMIVAIVFGLWSSSVSWAYAHGETKGIKKGRKQLHLELLRMWIKENGEVSNAPLLVPPPWIPSGNFDNINPKRYKKGNLQ